MYVRVLPERALSAAFIRFEIDGEIEKNFTLRIIICAAK